MSIIDRRPGPEWFQPDGIYGEAQRAKTRISFDTASSLERASIVNLSTDYWYFVPYVVMAVCPIMPDFLAEYANANNCDIEVKLFKYDRQLMPQLSGSKLDTSFVFGIRTAQAEDLFNFAKSIVVQVEAQKNAYRFMWEKVSIISPHVTQAMSSEKLVTQMIDVWVASVQSTNQYYFGRTAKDLRSIEFCRGAREDATLCHLVKSLWSGKTSGLIISTDP